MRPDALAPILDVAALEVVYFGEAGPVAAVRDVSFRIARQETLGLVGESGSGKSSIGLAIARQLPDNSRITKGSIRFDGVDLVQVEGRALRKARGHRIAMVYQDPSGALNPSLRIGPQIAEVYHVSGERDLHAGRDRVISMLERVRLPDAAYAYERYPHEFSGGQQQRIVIAMALAMNPDLLILDEPTTGLDVSVEAGILDLFDQLRRSFNAGILFISHNIAVIAKMCDRVGTLHDGRLVELGPTEEVLRRPSHPYTRALLAARIPFGATKPGAARLTPPGAGSDAVALVEVREARKSYRARGRRLEAVAGVDLEIAQGSVLGIVGESGSGKTTIARLIAGLLVPDAGKVFLHGRDITKLAEWRDRTTRSAIQMVFQNPDSTLNPQHRIGRILRRAALKLGGVHRTDAERLVNQAIESVRLEPRHLNAFPEELSGGQRQRVAIARAFIGGPELVICDEPTSALDVSIQASILQLLTDLQRREAASYIFISHDLAVVRYISDRIAVMYLGEVVAIGPADRIFEPPHHPYAEALLSAVLSLERRDKDQGLHLGGFSPSLLDRPTGCPFHTRCPRKVGPICETPPPWQETTWGDRYRCVIPPAVLEPLQRRDRLNSGSDSLKGDSMVQS
jgi:peptide/nickel transport system ATP-binding protein